MFSAKPLQRFVTTAAAFAAGLVMTAAVHAHCDGMDGPVITEAIAAIDAGDVTPILKWIPASDEAEIRALFDKTQTVRQLGDEAQQVADQHFLETLVRLHRAYEGAPFTGIMPSGTPVDPAVVRADAALVDGNIDPLADDIANAVRDSIKQKFAAAREAQAHKDQDVDHGRAFVAAYVDYVHHVEHLHQALTASHHHGHDAADAHTHAGQ